MINNKEKILIVGPAWVGDMVMAHSLYQMLARHRNNPVIDVLAPAWTLPLLSRFPEVRRGIELPFSHGQLELKQRWRLGRSLRSEQYDQAIVLPRSLKSAIIPFAAKAKRRSGYLGELRWGLLNDFRNLDKRMLPRTVDRFISLGLDKGELLPAKIPFPSISVEKDTAKEVLARMGKKLSGKPVIGLCPGAEYGPAKRWPAEYFAEIASQKLDEGWDVWLFGSGSDASIAKNIQSMLNERCLDLTGKTSIVEAADLMSLTALVVTNDSGLMHLAAAVDIPVIALYGSSNPKHTPPLSDRAKVLSLGLACSPCMKRECPLGHTNCLYQLKPELVLDNIPQPQ